MKSPRAIVSGQAKRRAKNSALGKPVLTEGGLKLSDYQKLSPLSLPSDGGPDALKKLGLPKKPRP